MSPRIFISTLLLIVSFCSLAQNKRDTIYVFVGQKISLKKLPVSFANDSDRLISYPNYSARYKIIQNIYGDIKEKTIKFDVNDHFGIPAFSKSKFSLLFVYKHNGVFHHIKYQYFDVYETTNGRWASCGDPYYFDEKYKAGNKTIIKAVNLTFKKPVTFKVQRSADSATVKEVFPEPYFKMVNQTAIGIMGCYAEDLFLVKKEGILKQLGYFD